MSEALSAAALQERIQRLIVDRLKLEIDPATIDPAQPLFGEGLGLDSVDALELVLGLEQEFDIRIDDGEIDSDTFTSVARLAEFVEAKRAAAAG